MVMWKENGRKETIREQLKTAVVVDPVGKNSSCPSSKKRRKIKKTKNKHLINSNGNLLIKLSEGVW